MKETLSRKDLDDIDRILYDKQTTQGKRYIRETGYMPFDRFGGEITYGYRKYMKWLERELDDARKRLKNG